MSKRDRPNPTLKLDSGKELTMSYLMINDILRFLGGPETAMQSLLQSQDTRDLVIRRLYTDTQKEIQDAEDLIPIKDMDIDIFDVDEIIAWVMEHVTYFFTRMSSRLEDSVTKYPEVRKALGLDEENQETTP